MTHLLTARDGDYLKPEEIAPEGSAPGLRWTEVRPGDHPAYLAVFGAGDEIVSGLEDFCNKVDFGYAAFRGIGAGRDFKLAWYALDRKAYRVIDVHGQVEILSLEGNIGVGQDGKHIVHCHVTVSDETGRTCGGHLLHGVVQPTLELFIDLSPVRPVKVMNPAVGLPLYDIG
ncbi:MAG: DUF296 domain-containing protein [Paracoccus denitrificans]|nr:MAG: DUF296 domain-containing protein [Paracoccus denitrificans]PZO84428.1 MAG: DUF296 domain-containing protein [Paracoccus denitrificans]